MDAQVNLCRSAPCERETKPLKLRLPKAENIEEVLRCAQWLFAARGYEAISMREIAAEAEIGLGTLNFYFGSKENLFSVAVERAVAQINRHRVELLAEASARANGAPDLEMVVHAIVWPVVSRASSPDSLERSIPRLVRWALVGPPMVEAALRREFDKVSARLLDALLAACPGLSREDAVRGFSAIVPILYSRQILDDRYAHFLDCAMQTSPSDSAELRASRLIRFAVAGLAGLRQVMPDSTSD